MRTVEKYISEINKLRQQKNAVILAHYYQEDDIQNLADFVGDSLALSKKAAETNADIIVFAGVHFMAETAKILNPTKKVLLPDLEAGCSLAQSCTADSFLAFKKQYPNHVTVAYINCSAEVKALCDIICTSANAEKIIASIPLDQPIIFAPDKNLGRYLIQKTGRDMVLWDGACVVHEAFSFDKLLALHKQYPQALIVAHPESEEHILRVAHYIGSTSGMINFIKNSLATTFIIATEVGILNKLAEEAPDKIVIPAPSKEDNTCACSECAFMRVNTVKKLYECLANETPEIHLDSALISAASKPLERMFELSN